MSVTSKLKDKDVVEKIDHIQYLDSVYCIPENVEKRKTYWKKVRIAK